MRSRPGRALRGSLWSLPHGPETKGLRNRAAGMKRPCALRVRRPFSPHDDRAALLPESEAAQERPAESISGAGFRTGATADSIAGVGIRSKTDGGRCFRCRFPHRSIAGGIAGAADAAGRDRQPEAGRSRGRRNAERSGADEPRDERITGAGRRSANRGGRTDNFIGSSRDLRRRNLDI